MVYLGKSGGNPDGLPSILTQIKRKFTFQNHGAVLYYHPKQNKKPFSAPFVGYRRWNNKGALEQREPKYTICYQLQGFGVFEYVVNGITNFIFCFLVIAIVYRIIRLIIR